MNYDVGVVLRHFLGKHGLSIRQKKRLDKSIELYKNKKINYIITTGGFGFFNHTDISLAEACKKYLIEKDISSEKIFIVSNSINTLTDIKLSKDIIEKNNFNSVLFITSFDHIGRVKKISKNIFEEKFILGFIISDYFAEFWTIWDIAWHIAGWLKYWIKKLNKSK
ncbi:MAG: YdcF family protein [Patescibacteria group bacterium]|nr:YdcF family protein [Patescibacteria group bacterium]